ncbi:TonB-dependent receptor [Luteolibacter pohnpeiensis]|uniref:TonB-dependent receptor n=1 Tax=Luteolibacter pohnpeiensis TaxID=454153 RepID=A0A934SB79_9BACT|nr:TonB-dependent receptor [Luteolibacter pohnpeiensis]MBK1882987.1 TonB-dependent receptor [Luteolibacter pohnpeiensis]
MNPTTYDKALELNLDPAVYGTFAEIGAGQETANWFFRASGTAGLVAKTISAYDMTMSDAIYGRADRYVSAARLESMLDHEFSILLERLGPKRGADTAFFSFCNTVRARGWNDEGECHGWLGVRFQMKPGDPPSDIILHVRLLDARTIDQMEALGVIGVNLIHAAIRMRGHLRQFVESLVDNLLEGRVEIDLLKFSGHGYSFFDNRLCALQLVESGLTDATMFLPNGEVMQPTEVLYRRPVLLLRGSFDPVMKIHLEMLNQARAGFSQLLEDEDKGREVEICEISMANLLRGKAVDQIDFLDRADALQSLGKTVLLSRCAEFHRIAAFLNRCTAKPVGILLSIGLLNELFKPKWSANLEGGVLESFGRLFKNGVTLHVFPWQNRRNGELVTAESFRPPQDSVHLYRHFLDNGLIVGIPSENPDLLAYTGRDICRMIIADDETWKQQVPEVAWVMAERHARLRMD